MGDDTASLNILLVTKGHPFERDAFFTVFDEMEGVDWTHVEQPAAQLFFTPENAATYDAIVLYDMPGLDFSEAPPVFVEPDEKYKQGLMDLLQEGKGMVFLHHALAGWPAWPEYGEIVGGRFLYQPGAVRGQECPDSGYRHDVPYRAEIIDASHPVTAGLGDGFDLQDELYLAEIFEDSVVPLIRSNHDFVAENFYSADHAVRLGKMFDNEGWEHATGSDLIGWVKNYKNSPICYLQLGDGPSAYENAAFRNLLSNAIRWAASGDAHSWARARAEERNAT